VHVGCAPTSIGVTDRATRTRLSELGIAPNLPVGKLSGGQRAQVALALAKRPHSPRRVVSRL
jgi:ATPase subunit of ABC transporter with duplicated ATPase domains